MLGNIITKRRPDLKFTVEPKCHLGCITGQSNVKFAHLKRIGPCNVLLYRLYNVNASLKRWWNYILICSLDVHFITLLVLVTHPDEEPTVDFSQMYQQ